MQPSQFIELTNPFIEDGPGPGTPLVESSINIRPDTREGGTRSGNRK